MNPTRGLLLWLSRRRAVGEALERSPLRDRLVSRFVAGGTATEAVARAQPLLERGFTVTFSFLGEDVRSRAEAKAAEREYQALVAAIAAAGIGPQSVVAVKPTLLGLAADAPLAERCLGSIAAAAREAGARVELDMERSPLVDATLALFRSGVRVDPAMGIAQQAYLHRAAADVEALLAEGIARVRLVKGAYAEPASVAVQDAASVRQAFHALMRRLLSAEAQAGGGVRLAVATHDPSLLAATRTQAFRNQLGREAWEVQLLYGVRPSLRDRLLGEGYPVRVYLPYGAHWYPYFMRRLAERPANLWFALREVFGR